MKPIIDLSQWQPPASIAYEALSTQIAGVILRAVYANRKDTAFDEHYHRFTELGVPVGAYHFISEYVTVTEQVAVMKSACTGKHLELGRWCDIELEPRAEKLTKQTVHAYLQQAEAEIGEFDIYTSKNYWNQIMGGAYYTQKRLWVAHYGAVKPAMPNGWLDWWLWQYTDKGRLTGYIGNIDCNYFCGDETLFNEWVERPPVIPTEPLTELYYPIDTDKDYPITQMFGERPEIYTVSKGHNGIDWGFHYTIGNPIYAVADGIVEVATKQKTGYGRHIRIRHSHGVTIYGHLKEMFVQVGDNVLAKQLIGTNGGNVDDPYKGYSTGAHLHFEYRWDKPAPQVPGGFVYNAVDPLPLLIPHEKENMLYKVKVIVNALNVRIGAGITFQKVGTISKDTIHEVYEEKDGWLRIGVSRWISGNSLYVERVDNTIEQRLADLERRVALLEGA